MKKSDNKRGYGPITAVCVVVGSVIGSGVFFKTASLINMTRGDNRVVLIAWTVGGIIMLMCLFSFVCMLRYTKSGNGLGETASEIAGKNYAYYVNWFMATIYYPALASVLSLLAAGYTLLFLGVEYSLGGCITLACTFLMINFFQNTFCPKISGKIQTTATFLKLIPLVLMIISGIKNGIDTGLLKENMSVNIPYNNKTLFASVSAVVFAYEGWIAGLNISGNVRNSRKNLPLSLFAGGCIIVAVYVLYYLGIMGSVPGNAFINHGKDGIKIAFSSILGEEFAGLLILFVAISCLGALNSMVFSAGKVMDNICGNKKRSFIASVLISLLWLFLFFDFSISKEAGRFGFDVSEVPVITLYIMYIPIFIMFLKKWGKLLRRYEVLVIVSGILACVVTAFCAFFAHISDVADYLIVWSGIMLMGKAFKK